MKINKPEWKWVLLWALVIVLLSSVPYLWGVHLASAVSGQGDTQYHFLGFTHNIDDGAVYLSWMRQAADGQFFIRNLFTNEPQAARQFNVLFLIMGWFASLTHLPLALVYHIFRAIFAVALIFTIWKFSKLFLRSPLERRLLIPLVGFSAGLGWLMVLVADTTGLDWPIRMPVGPVDKWQPEAFTFLSIYLNPLFLAGQMLMLAAFYHLVLAQRTGKLRHAVYAGLFVLLLGSIHTYDVITVAGVWACYVLALGIIEKRFPARLLALSLVAAAIAIPSSAYQFYLYSTDEVFRARADSEIFSPALWAYFVGYGLVFIGAAAGAVLAITKERQDRVGDSKYRLRHIKLLLIVWSIIGFALPYIPVGQQRKLIMGIHIPLCILCAYALAQLVHRLPSSLRRVISVVLISFTSIGSLQFVCGDVLLLNQGKTSAIHPAFISQHQVDIMSYLRQHAEVSDTILAPPSFALFVPAFTGRQVYYGHWSETPDYKGKINEWFELVNPATGLDRQLSMIERSAASYYVTIGEETLPSEALLSTLVNPPEYESGDTFLYRIRRNPDTP